MLDEVAQWANDLGLSFNATQDLSVIIDKYL